MSKLKKADFRRSYNIEYGVRYSSESNCYTASCSTYWRVTVSDKDPVVALQKLITLIQSRDFQLDNLADDIKSAKSNKKYLDESQAEGDLRLFLLQEVEPS
jgi:hypothetical protein